ncbi:MAG TPA: HEAT repeat domain-containing protein [Blastocatellia bacterium]|nr:HEAT repeat domain-containing protein [Blastocatellia bacterium]
MNRLLSILNYSLFACLSLLIWSAVNCQAIAQEVISPQQERLALLLSSGNDEQKLEALIEMGTLISGPTSRATPKTISILGSLLQSDASPVIRALAARAMELNRDEKCLPFLLSALKNDREPAVLKAIIYALAYQRSPEVIETLVRLLNDKKQEIRAASAFALAEIGAPASTKAFIDLLRKRGNDEDAFARKQAVRGLGNIGDPVAIDALLTVLNRDKSSEVRRQAVFSLGRIAKAQDTKVIEALKLATLQSDPYLAALAASALEKFRL